MCSLVPFISTFISFLLTPEKLAVIKKGIVFACSKSRKCSFIIFFYLISTNSFSSYNHDNWAMIIYALLFFIATIYHSIRARI